MIVPSGTYSYFTYPLLRFMQTWNIKENDKYMQMIRHDMRSIALLCDDSIQLQEQEVKYKMT